MESVPVTRMELLARRRQADLAEQGRDLLDEKRQALMRELMKMVEMALQENEELDRAASGAMEALDLASALDGPEAVHRAALGAAGTHTRFEVTFEAATVMGVPVPIISLDERVRGLLDRGYALADSSARVDQVAETFEELLRRLVRMAESDVRLRRVGGEIQRTARRVNALRHAVIPSLQADVQRIGLALEEHEREEHNRLKHVRRLRERKARRDGALDAALM